VVPGVTSALAVPALAGIPVTQRGVATSLVITTGHSGAEPAALAAITSKGTAVFLMGVNAMGEICAAALRAGADPATPVAIIEQGSTPHQRVTRGDLLSIKRLAAEIPVKPPAVIVVGEVARADFLASEACATQPD
jgi:uroporphyrin-III C-methyltransferase/precorrin-2 dehydrogenase/sirohydrochlorin ferrochelatase